MQMLVKNRMNRVQYVRTVGNLHNSENERSAARTALRARVPWTQCRVKEVRHIGVHTAWFHLYKVRKQVSLGCGKSGSSRPLVGVGGNDRKKAGGTGSILFPGLGASACTHGVLRVWRRRQLYTWFLYCTYFIFFISCVCSILSWQTNKSTKDILRIWHDQRAQEANEQDLRIMTV